MTERAIVEVVAAVDVAVDAAVVDEVDVNVFCCFCC